jgi:hypothetical protein
MPVSGDILSMNGIVELTLLVRKRLIKKRAALYPSKQKNCFHQEV